MAVKKKPYAKPSSGAPTLKQRYGGYHVYDLRYGQKKPTPKRGNTSLERNNVSYGTLSKITKNVTDFANSNGVDVESVRISVGYQGLNLSANRPETDDEYNARVRKVESWNKALEECRADQKAIEEWHKDQQMAAEAAVKQTVSTELKSEIKDKMRSNAKFMAALTDEVLSDEKFIKQLKVLFTKGL